MANTYTWTINSMATMPSPPAPANEYVVNVRYTVTGTDGTHTASIQGNKTFDFSNKSPTAYASLTQAEVLGWIQDANTVASMQANIDGQIASLVTPPISPTTTALPWSA